LSADEKVTLEHEWKAAFQEAWAHDFTLNNGSGELLRGDCARAAHYEHHDIPRELVRRWEKAARRRRTRAERQPVLPRLALDAGDGGQPAAPPQETAAT